jgi:hypothetical protein
MQEERKEKVEERMILASERRSENEVIQLKKSIFYLNKWDIIREKVCQSINPLSET